MDWDLFFIDAILLSMLVIFFYKGYRKGIINQVIWFCSIILAYFVAAHFCYELADYAQFPVYDKNVSVAVSFVIIFLSVVTAMYYIGRYLTKLVNLTVVGVVNSMLGGLLNGLVYIIIIVSLSNVSLFLLPKDDKYFDKTVSLSELVKFEKWLMDQNYIDKIEKKIKDLTGFVNRWEL